MKIAPKSLFALTALYLSGGAVSVFADNAHGDAALFSLTSCASTTFGFREPQTVYAFEKDRLQWQNIDLAFDGIGETQSLKLQRHSYRSSSGVPDTLRALTALREGVFEVGSQKLFVPIYHGLEFMGLNFEDGALLPEVSFRPAFSELEGLDLFDKSARVVPAPASERPISPPGITPIPAFTLENAPTTLAIGDIESRMVGRTISPSLNNAPFGSLVIQARQDERDEDEFYNQRYNVHILNFETAELQTRSLEDYEDIEWFAVYMDEVGLPIFRVVQYDTVLGGYAFQIRRDNEWETLIDLTSLPFEPIFPKSFSLEGDGTAQFWALMDIDWKGQHLYKIDLKSGNIELIGEYGPRLLSATLSSDRETPLWAYKTFNRHLQFSFLSDIGKRIYASIRQPGSIYTDILDWSDNGEHLISVNEHRDNFVVVKLIDLDKQGNIYKERTLCKGY